MKRLLGGLGHSTEGFAFHFFTDAILGDLGPQMTVFGGSPDCVLRKVPKVKLPPTPPPRKLVLSLFGFCSSFQFYFNREDSLESFQVIVWRDSLALQRAGCCSRRCL